MEKVMQVGREASPEFFMWHEAFGSDWPGTGYSTHTGADSFLWDLNRCGPNRLVFRSGSIYNLYGGFARINPQEDSGIPHQTLYTRESYRSIAEDPMNKWLVKFVKDYGCRDAVGVAKGVSLCAGHIVVDPGSERSVRIPESIASAKRLKNVFTGETLVPADQDAEGLTYLLQGATAYEIEG